MAFWKRFFGKGDLPDMCLVLALSKAVQQKFSQYPPEMAAAVFLAMTDEDRADIVERPEGIYLSRLCWERISSYTIWHAYDGEIIITKPRPQNGCGKKDKEMRSFLNKRLPKAREIGGISSFHYVLGLALVFGLDTDTIRVQDNNKGAAIF